MLKMMTYQEANGILGTSLSPNNYCICRKTAIDNGADEAKLNLYTTSSQYNRLVPVSAVNKSGYVIKFVDRECVHGDVITGIPNGVYAYMPDGTIYTASQLQNVSNKTDAIGVALITDNVQFVIDKYWSPNLKFGAYGESDGIANLQRQGLKTAREESEKRAALNWYTGYEDTQKIYQFKDVLNSSETTRPEYGVPAVEYCKTRFGGDGYMGSVGEYYEIHKHLADVDDIMIQIGGDTLLNGEHTSTWTTTIYIEDNYYSTGSWNPAQCTFDFYFGTPQYDNNVGYVREWDRGSYQWVRPLGRITTISCTETLLQIMRLEEGQTPNPITPVKYGYTFDSWTPSIHPATKNETYVATWSQAELPKYTIKFVDTDGTLLQTLQVTQGQYPNPDRPTKSGYVFQTWDPVLAPATQDTTYTARWIEERPAVNYYTAVFKDSEDFGGGTIHQTIVEEGQIPTTPQSPSHEGYSFVEWTPAIGPIYSNTVYTAVYVQDGYIDDDEQPVAAGNLGRYGFGTDSDGESKGQFLRIDGEGIYDYGNIVLNVTLKKYVNESVQSTVTGTITLNNWKSSVQPSITISQDLQNAGLVDLGTTTTTGQAIVEIGSSDSVRESTTRLVGPPRGVHYVMDISTNNSITYSGAISQKIEGKNNVIYYNRLYIPKYNR